MKRFLPVSSYWLSLAFLVLRRLDFSRRLATMLVYNSNISDGVYSSVVIATVGAYLTSNVFQKKIEVKE